MSLDKLKKFLQTDEEIRTFIKDGEIYKCYATLRHKGFSSREIGSFTYILFKLYNEDLNTLIHKIAGDSGALPSEAFAYYDFGDTLTVPKYITEIEPSAFFMSQFRQVILPDTLTRLGDGAFEECGFIDDIWINGHISYIPEYFLYNVMETCKVHINDNIKEIRNQAFLNNKNPVILYYDGTIERFKHIKLSHNWCAGTKVDVICSDGRLVYKDSRLVGV